MRTSWQGSMADSLDAVKSGVEVDEITLYRYAGETPSLAASLGLKRF